MYPLNGSFANRPHHDYHLSHVCVRRARPAHANESGEASVGRLPDPVSSSTSLQRSAMGVTLHALVAGCAHYATCLGCVPGRTGHTVRVAKRSGRGSARHARHSLTVLCMALAFQQAKWAVLRNISLWTDPGDGGYYDDLGGHVANRAATHVIQKSDPRWRCLISSAHLHATMRHTPMRARGTCRRAHEIELTAAHRVSDGSA